MRWNGGAMADKVLSETSLPVLILDTTAFESLIMTATKDADWRGFGGGAMAGHVAVHLQQLPVRVRLPGPGADLRLLPGEAMMMMMLRRRRRRRKRRVVILVTL
jgi:hypothetical protein